MLQIILIRPGATDYDEQHRIQGTLDMPLSEGGRRQIEQGIETLRPLDLDVIYASPNKSADETARAIGDALDVKVKTLEKLQNLNQGLWQGMSVEEIRFKQPRLYKQWQEHPETVCPPHGEMLISAQNRVEQVLAKLMKKHKDGVVGVVVPEPLARMIHSYFKADAVDDLWKPAACGTWEAITIEPVASGAAP